MRDKKTEVKAKVIRDVKINLMMVESKKGDSTQEDFDRIQREVGRNVANQMEGWTVNDGEEFVRMVVADFIGKSGA